MEFISKIRWVIVVFVLLLALILVGWGLSAIARNVIDGIGTETTEVEETNPLNVTDLRTVRFTVEGPIVASEDHRSYTVEASENVVSIKLYSEYGQKIITEKSYKNNAQAYESLLNALDKADATKRVSGTDEEDDYDEKGACPKGKRYILELGDDVRRWSTSCKTVDGTADGEMFTIRDIFNKQIPDFRDIVSGTNLR